MRAPNQQRIVINGANIDRFVAILQNYRELEHPEPMDELATLMKATDSFNEYDLKLMFVIMLQREVDRL